MADKMRRIGRLGLPTVLAASGQALALVQIALLLVGAGAGPASNAYFYIVPWIQIPWQVGLLGVIYPPLVRGDRIPLLRFWLWVIPLMSVATAAIAGGVFWAISTPYPDLPLHVALLGLVGLFSSALWAAVIRLAAVGRAAWMAAVTLPANMAGAAAVALTMSAPLSERVTAMLVGQIVGSVAFGVIVGTRSGLLRIARQAPSSAAVARSSAHRWFLAQSSVGYGAGLMIQTQTASLQGNALSAVGVISRIVGGIGAVTTNAVLPRLVHDRSEDGNPVRRFVRAMNVAGWVTFPIVAAFSWWLSSLESYLGVLILTVPWVMSANLNASTKRVAARFLPPHFATMSIAAAVLIPALLATLQAVGLLSLTAVLCAMILMDLVPAFLLAFRLRMVPIALSTTFCFALSVAIYVTLIPQI